MESPKYCLEAVAIWGKVKIKKGGHVKALMSTAIAIITARAGLN